MSPYSLVTLCLLSAFLMLSCLTHQSQCRMLISKGWTDHMNGICQRRCAQTPEQNRAMCITRCLRLQSDDDFGSSSKKKNSFNTSPVASSSLDDGILYCFSFRGEIVCSEEPENESEDAEDDHWEQWTSPEFFNSILRSTNAFAAASSGKEVPCFSFRGRPICRPVSENDQDLMAQFLEEEFINNDDLGSNKKKRRHNKGRSACPCYSFRDRIVCDPSCDPDMEG